MDPRRLSYAQSGFGQYSAESSGTPPVVSASPGSPPPRLPSDILQTSGPGFFAPCSPQQQQQLPQQQQQRFPQQQQFYQYQELTQLHQQPPHPQFYGTAPYAPSRPPPFAVPYGTYGYPQTSTSGMPPRTSSYAPARSSSGSSVSSAGRTSANRPLPSPPANPPPLPHRSAPADPRVYSDPPGSSSPRLSHDQTSVHSGSQSVDDQSPPGLATQSPRFSITSHDTVLAYPPSAYSPLEGRYPPDVKASPESLSALENQILAFKLQYEESLADISSLTYDRKCLEKKLHDLTVMDKAQVQEENLKIRQELLALRQTHQGMVLDFETKTAASEARIRDLEAFRASATSLSMEKELERCDTGIELSKEYEKQLAQVEAKHKAALEALKEETNRRVSEYESVVTQFRDHSRNIAGVVDSLKKDRQALLCKVEALELSLTQQEESATLQARLETAEATIGNLEEHLRTAQSAANSFQAQSTLLELNISEARAREVGTQQMLSKEQCEKAALLQRSESLAGQLQSLSLTQDHAQCNHATAEAANKTARAALEVQVQELLRENDNLTKSSLEYEDQAKAVHAQMRDRILGLTNDISSLKAQFAVSTQTIETLHKDLEASKQDLAATKEDSATSKQDLEATKKNLVASKKDLESARKALSSLESAGGVPALPKLPQDPTNADAVSLARANRELAAKLVKLEAAHEGLLEKYMAVVQEMAVLR